MDSAVGTKEDVRNGTVTDHLNLLPNCPNSGSNSDRQHYGFNDLGRRPRVVICGSYSPTTLWLIVDLMEKFQKEGWDVFPTAEHIKDSQIPIEAHHLKTREESDVTISLRGKLSWTYLEKISSADLLYIINEKEGKEYIGCGALMEIGFGLAYGIAVAFYRPPENANVISLLKEYKVLPQEEGS